MLRHISGKKVCILKNKIAFFEELVKEKISEKRFEHTKRVLITALELAEKHNVSKEKVQIAALLHDYAKNLSSKELVDIIEKYGGIVTSLEKMEPEILHGPAAAIIAEKELGIKDSEILESIKYHTTGNENLSELAKIVFIADAIEPLRDYPGVQEIREAAMIDLDKACLLSLNSTLDFLLRKERLIHPLSIKARNYLIMKKLRSEVIE